MTNKISSCGYDCSKCPIYVATVNNDLNELRHILFVGPDREHLGVNDLGCLGCHNDKNINNQMCSTCYIRKCCTEKNIENCAHCSEFACDYLKCYISVETMETLEKVNKELKK